MDLTNRTKATEVADDRGDEEEPKADTKENKAAVDTASKDKKSKSASKDDGNDEPGGEKYGVADAYKWLYGALLRQPASRGLPATAVALLASFGEGSLASVPAVLLGEIVDAIGLVDNTGHPWPLFGLIALSLVGKEVCTVARKFIVEGQATALQKDAFLDQAHHLLSVRVDALQDRRVGDLAVRLDKSVEGLVKLTKLTFMEAIPNLMTAAVALSLAVNAHWSVGVAMIGAVVAGGLVTAAQVKKEKGVRIALNDQKADLGGSVAEMLGNLSYIRASGMRRAEELRLEEGAEALRMTEFLHHKYMMTFSGTKDLIEGLGFAAVVAVAITLALRNEITSGDILTLSMLYMKAVQPLTKMHGVFDKLHESVIKIGALSAVRGLPDDPGLSGELQPINGTNAPFQAKDLSVTLKRKGMGSLVCNRVLSDLSLDLERGTVVGLAGTSGSGKSTLLKAALGLIPDYEGSLMIFGRETRDLDKSGLSQYTAYAQQEPFVLTGTLRDNLRLTQPYGLNDELDLDDAALWKALDQSCLGPADFEWAQGLDTHIHEAGRNLSGGQRQRLALARIFLQRNAELIVLDEATSALDNATESRVIEEMHAHAADMGRTVVMVAHRLTTLRGADRVLLMDDGRIVQDGSYVDLSKEDGIFRDLLHHNQSH